MEQDFKSIAPYTIEEAYEVAEAIDQGSMEDLKEELGDLLFQSVYHAQMAKEQGAFDFNDVVQHITDKMIHRHPHVFGDTDAKTAQDVNVLWDERKALEKEKGDEAPKSAIDGVPRALPALLRASKLTKKAAKTGFEWAQISDVLAKLEEELSELREALESGSAAEKTEELGDVLFVLANLGRMLDINPEEALRQTNHKFERRFKGMEDDIGELGLEQLSDASLDQMTLLWNKQKSKL